MKRAARRLVSLAGAAGLVGAASVYPFDGTWLAPILLAYIALLCWRPPLWLGLLPMLLPVLDLAPWTGWFFLEEIDLLLLATVMVGYWRARDEEPAARLPGAVRAGIVLMSVAWAVSCYRGLMPLQAIDLNSFANYLGPYNALRVAKSWAWALLLLPLLVRDAGPGLARIGSHFFPGMMGGYVLVALAALRERIAFPGLLDMASDYRTSAPFSAMHTGGAELDGYLALCSPLVALWVWHHPSRLKTGAALLVLALGAYAVLTTFSRGLFLAYGASWALLAILAVAPHWRRGHASPRQLMLGGALSLAAAGALAWVFATSGYRGLFAALLVLLAALMLCTQSIRPTRLLPSLLVALGLEALLLAMLSFSAPATAGILKPPYLLFAAASSLFAVSSWRPPGQDSPLRALAFFCMLLNFAFIGWHWNGARGLQGTFALIALVAALLSYATLAGAVWKPRPHAIGAGLAGLVLLALAIPVAESYYAAERFDSSGSDLALRTRHWQRTAQLMDREGAAPWLGMGAGTYPALYFWHNQDRELPGTIGYIEEDGQRMLRVLPPQYALGYGEALRVLQRVALKPHRAYRFEADIRRGASATPYQIALCERQLLYPSNCIELPLRPGAPGAWRHVSAAFQSGLLDSGRWLGATPIQLEILVSGERASVDFDNISLVDIGTQEQLVRNGSFAAGMDHWFFSSDHHHLPWHVKNLALQQYLEQGWLGVAALAVLLLAGAGELLTRAVRGDTHAAVCAAGLCGFLLVGFFDSLIDVPRLALILYLFLFAALLRPAR